MIAAVASVRRPSRGPRRLTAASLLIVLALLGFIPTPSATARPAGMAASTDVLARWRSALADRQSAGASWVAIGDSITEGQGAASRGDRWIDRTTADLRRLYPTKGATGGAGFLPGWYAVKAPDSPWQPYSTRTGTVTNGRFGSLGQRTAELAAGASQTYSVTGTSADLYYATGGGTMTYQVDSGPVRTVSTGGRQRTSKRIALYFSTAGTHRLIVRSTAGTVDLEGVMVFDGDRNKGIRLLDSAHSGFDSTQFLAARGDLDPLLALIEPDLITIELGANDYLKPSATPARLATNLRSEIADLRTALASKIPSIVVVLTYAMPVRSNRVTDWSAYDEALRSVIRDDPSVGLLDFSSMGRAAPGGYFSADGLHPSTSGQARMAQLATTYLGSR